MKGTRIGGGYMVVGYVSGGGIWSRWWYMDTNRWCYMDTDSERWKISGGGRWQGRWWWCGGGGTTYDQNRNSKRLDSKTSNLTRRCNWKFNKVNTEKVMQWLRLVWIWWTNPNFFGFFVDYRYEEQTRSKLWKTVKSHWATGKSNTTW